MSSTCCQKQVLCSRTIVWYCLVLYVTNGYPFVGVKKGRNCFFNLQKYSNLLVCKESFTGSIFQMRLITLTDFCSEKQAPKGIKIIRAIPRCSNALNKK